MSEEYASALLQERGQHTGSAPQHSVDANLELNHPDDDFESWLQKHDPENYQLLRGSAVLPDGEVKRKARRNNQSSRPLDQGVEDGRLEIPRQRQRVPAPQPRRLKAAISGYLTTEDEAGETDEPDEDTTTTDGETGGPAAKSFSQRDVAAAVVAARQREHQQRQQHELSILQQRMSHVQQQQDELRRSLTPKKPISSQREARNGEASKPLGAEKPAISLQQALANNALIDQIIADDMDIQQVDKLTKKLQMQFVDFYEKSSGDESSGSPKGSGAATQQ